MENVAGVDTGTTLRVSGKGGASINGKNGDLFVKIQVIQNEI